MNIFGGFAFLIPLIVSFYAVDANKAVTHPHTAETLDKSVDPALEELVVVRQKEFFVARRYGSYNTIEVRPKLSARDESMKRSDIDKICSIVPDEFTVIYPFEVYDRHVVLYPQLSLVIDLDDDLTSFIIGSTSTCDGVKYGHISSLHVLYKYRRHKYGTILMKEFESNCIKKKCKYINLYVNRRNSIAITFYKGQGYYIHRILVKYYSDEEDALEMRKQLI